jgi:hypothetical protein
MNELFQPLTSPEFVLIANLSQQHWLICETLFVLWIVSPLNHKAVPNSHVQMIELNICQRLGNLPQPLSEMGIPHDQQSKLQRSSWKVHASTCREIQSVDLLCRLCTYLRLRNSYSVSRPSPTCASQLAQHFQECKQPMTCSLQPFDRLHKPASWPVDLSVGNWLSDFIRCELLQPHPLSYLQHPV